VAGIVALAVIVKACGDSKPRVQDIPQEASSPSLADAPRAAAPAVATPSPEPLVTGPVTFADGETAFHERRFEQAAALFTAYTVQRPENAWGYYMLGLSEWKAGRAERAVPAFESALAQDSTHRKALLNLTRVLLEMGKAEEALARAERAVQLDSGNAEGWRLVGRARSDLGRTDDAVSAYRHALALDENDSWSMNNLGMIYLQAGRYPDALPPLARAAELAPERATFQNNLGLALERTGHPTAAAVAYRAAIAADTTHGKAIASLARVDGRSDAEGSVPVDLAALARAFADEIGRWKEELAVVVKP
jgi:tetratricopeptide (TPR) repeat protein